VALISVATFFFVTVVLPALMFLSMILALFQLCFGGPPH
jgi:hypothetical protein